MSMCVFVGGMHMCIPSHGAPFLVLSIDKHCTSDYWDLRVCLHPEQGELKWRVQRFAIPVFFFCLFCLRCH